MILNKNFITHEIEGEQVIVATGNVEFSGLIRNNQTAAFIVEQLKKETSIQEIVDKVFEKYDAPKEVIEKDVVSIVNSLRKIGAVDD